MERTKPNANFQPQIVQYRPAERSMLRNVPPFVRPSSNSFAFVRTNSSTNLNFTSSAPTAPTPAAPLPQGDPCFGATGRLSKARLRSRIRAETTVCWLESGGRSSSAWRHAASAALVSPAWAVRSAPVDLRRSSTKGYAAAGRAAAWYGPVTCRATPRLSFHASYSANPAINKWIGLVMPIMIGAAYASAMITARPRGIAGRPGRGDVLGAASVGALTPAATAAGEAARALHSFCSSRAISEESVTTTAV